MTRPYFALLQIIGKNLALLVAWGNLFLIKSTGTVKLAV
jgi:hypothetical protein